MGVTINTLKCPNCGGSVERSSETCKYCGNQILISSFSDMRKMQDFTMNKYARSYQETLLEDVNDVEINVAVAMCYMKLKLFEKAQQYLEKAIENNFEYADGYFFYAICLLDGKKPFLHLRDTIKQCQKYLDAAIAIEPKGIYYFFSAYIAHDYYYRKSYNCSPSWEELLLLAKSAGLSRCDVEDSFDIIGLTIPEFQTI